jgi:hypothetical protein
MPVRHGNGGAAHREATGVRGNLGLLALGLCIGVCLGLVIAPHGWTDTLRVVGQRVQAATAVLGHSNYPEEWPEDLAV